jgi:hypothetical protein
LTFIGDLLSVAGLHLASHETLPRRAQFNQTRTPAGVESV